MIKADKNIYLTEMKQNWNATHTTRRESSMHSMHVYAEQYRTGFSGSS